MERNYTTVGKAEATPEDINKAVNTLEWTNNLKDVPFSQGYAIKAAIKQCKIPKVTHIAYHGIIFNKYGFYGIRGHYSNGMVEVYLMDIGTKCIIMASDFHNN